MNVLLLLCGFFVLVDGVANVLYCLLKRVHYPVGKLFQLGRLIRAIAGILILLSAFRATAQAQTQITVLENQEFSVFSNNELVTNQTIFNVSLPQGNCTLNLEYENTLEGVKHEDCFLKSVTVLLDDKPVFSKNFAENNVQGLTLSEQVTVLSTGNHTGLLILAGIGEKEFYGTFNLSFETQGNGSSQDLEFVGLDWWLWLIFMASGATAAVVAIVIRRRSHD